MVYKAHDTILDHTVALKVLPLDLEACEPERARFLHWTEAASALNHPNNCAIHALGEHGGQQFIDMESGMRSKSERHCRRHTRTASSIVM